MKINTNEVKFLTSLILWCMMRVKRERKTNNSNNLPKTNLEIKNIIPKTENQKLVFEYFIDDYNLLLHGAPGTGKSFLSLYLSLKEILSGKSTFKKIVIVRSAQPSKNIGFLPGTQSEKMKVYEAPYKNICSELFGRDDAYEVLKDKKLIEFESTSFLRGITLDNSIIIFDEIQNSNYMEAKTVLSRVGENSRIMMCGDIYQDDLTSERYNETSGLPKLMKILDEMESVAHVEFDVDDILRSGFVKDFIIAELEYG